VNGALPFFSMQALRAKRKEMHELQWDLRSQAFAYTFCGTFGKYFDISGVAVEANDGMRTPHAQQPPMSFRCDYSNERSVLFMTRAASSLWGMRRSKNSFGLTTGHTRTSIYVDTQVAIIGWRADRYCVRMASMMVLVS
jgi:hypothetical protein